MTQLEKDLLTKTRPKWGSKRWNRLYASCSTAFMICEVCGTVLLNPQSILIHQGNVCQKLLSSEQNVQVSDTTEDDSKENDHKQKN